MKIIELSAENYRRLRAIRWRPGPHVNEIRGKNESGKTSLLDSIWISLCGTRVDCDEPIRNGANSAQVELDLGDLKVRRVWTQSGRHLVVEDRDGNPKRSPQALLDSLASSLGMDPIAFSRMAPKQQVETLLGVFGVDVSDLDEAEKELADVRKEKSREAKHKRAAADGIKVWTAATDGEPRNITEEEFAVVRMSRENTLSRIAQLRASLAEAEDSLRDYDQILAQETLYNQKTELEGDASYLEYEAEQIVRSIEAVRTERKQRLAAVESKVPGLTVEDGQIRLDGLPLSQASAGRRIRVGLMVAVTANPTLRLILIRDASLLDDEAMLEVEQFAQEHDVQILLERVGTDAPGGHGILISEGQAVAKNEPPSTGDDRPRRQTWDDTKSQAEDLF